MKAFVLILFTLSSAIFYGQAQDFDGGKWEAPYILPAPEGWGIERFPIPISFAPQILHKGVEDIRFAPGWAKVTSEEYWSYAFLWYLEGDVYADAGMIGSDLKMYYTGLIGSNKNIPIEKLIPVETSFQEIKKDEADLKTFSGTINMLDYMAQKPMTLHCKVHLRSCLEKNKTFLFFELSPQPVSHTIWQSLDKLWLDFKCKQQ